MSSILIEKNRQSSSSKHTRHMNIRIFFIKDRVDSKEVPIEYCPAGNMIADFFMKPLQGRHFTICWTKYWTLIWRVNTIQIKEVCWSQMVRSNGKKLPGQKKMVVICIMIHFMIQLVWSYILVAQQPGAATTALMPVSLRRSFNTSVKTEFASFDCWYRFQSLPRFSWHFPK